MSFALLASTFAAGFLYIVMPGPAVLALFALAASEGRPAAARFVTGHLVGDVVWGTLALAAIIGVAQVGAAIFQALGLACGLYLCWLGYRALIFRGGGSGGAIGSRNPLATGIVFGLTNPKAYPVSLAMFTALADSVPDARSLVYIVKVFAVAAALWYYRKSYTELKFRFTPAIWGAALVGVLVIVVWVVTRPWA